MSMKEMDIDVDNHFKHWNIITLFYWKLSCNGAFHIWDNDNLRMDMGWNPMLKKNWFSKIFYPYSNLNYQEMYIILDTYQQTNKAISSPNILLLLYYQ